MSEKPSQEPTLEDIAAASAAMEGKFPTAVLDAFLPPLTSHLGQKLVPLSAGHELLLAQIQHPLAVGGKWDDQDVLMALFLFSRPSRLSFAMVADGTLEAEFFAFIDAIPSADIPALGKDMVSHWVRSRNTALAMENEHAKAQKKTADSDGGSTRLRQLAKRLAGCLTRLFTTFLLRRFSR
jgi:hypothetical protein